MWRRFTRRRLAATSVARSHPRLLFWLNIGLYDSIDWWDDANHFVNWALLCGALGTILLRTSLGPLVLFAIVAGFGAAAAILWEIDEYFAFIRGGTELATAYTDTLGDEVLGLSGAICAAAATALVARRRAPKRERTLSPGQLSPLS